MTAIDTLRDALYTSDGKPSREGVLKAFSELSDLVAGASLGIAYYATDALMRAVTPGADDPQIAIVNADPDSTKNGINTFRNGAWTPFQEFYQGLLSVFGPLTDQYTNVSYSVSGLVGIISKMIGYPLAFLQADNFTYFVDVATPDWGVKIDVVITKDAVANTTFLNIGGRSLRLANGGGGTIPPADIKVGKIFTVSGSQGGQIWVFESSRDVGSNVVPDRINDQDFIDNIFGTVSFSSGVRNVATVPKYIVTPGSSNAAASYQPNADTVPANMIANALNDAFAGEGVVFQPNNPAEPGAPFTAMANQLATVVPYVNGIASFVFPFFWMNDARTIFYHSYNGVKAQMKAFEDGIKAANLKNAQVVAVLGFPPDMRQSTTALDPNWFADTSESGGANQPMNFPAYKAAPVSPENDMWPPKSSPLTGPRDWTGSGVLRQGYKRVWHVNRMIEEIALANDCMILDFQSSVYRFCIETVPDMGSGLDAFYEQGNPLHPKPLLYTQGMLPPIKEFARAVASGDTSKRIFKGF